MKKIQLNHLNMIRNAPPERQLHDDDDSLMRISISFDKLISSIDLIH